MNLLYSKFDCSFEATYSDNKKVDIYYTFKVKRTFKYIFNINENCMVRSVNHFIGNFLHKFYNSKELHEGNDINRIIDTEKLEALNNTLNAVVDTYFDDIKIKDIKIKYLI